MEFSLSIRIVETFFFLVSARRYLHKNLAVIAINHAINLIRMNADLCFEATAHLLYNTSRTYYYVEK